ncbi:lipocalin-like domain-containing protein [Sphingomonas solaris]|uniref:Carotenoid 1,2-hydratase n=1 Tax=Alterirhizorhabdus solaris TaxID=2529389 RepID=A0A558QUA5_9SPHN|nr:carotenoid 1,2-hydratase [Sphingomonas solaris]TVV70726.1 carotenoid 1,2-hydratase [Sphingomonas solaris]
MPLFLTAARLTAALAALSLAAAPVVAAAQATAAPRGYPVVRPGIAFRFPADHGAHPAYRTEWWYATGWLRTADGHDLGFQITFFRVRPKAGATPARSRFAPTQLMFAHAALSDPATGRLLHGERAARAGFGLAGARIGDADVTIRDWRLRRLPDGRFVVRAAAPGFTLDLTLRPTQPPLAQGLNGYSRKGARPAEASYYYSLPHLAVTGAVTRQGRRAPVTGQAWLDREWSSDYLAPGAAGWDWTGLNLDDGGALMAFRIRGKDGRTMWAGGSLRHPDGTIERFTPADVHFRPLGWWTSRATGARYPVAQELSVRLRAGIRRFRLTPLFAAQELDARGSGLPVYWEGAVRTQGGRGYLELTGYQAPLAM